MAKQTAITNMTAMNDVAAAAAVAREQAYTRRQELLEREGRWQQFFGHPARTNEAARPSPSELLLIRKARPTERELALADEAVAQADEAWMIADAAIKQAFREELLARKRPAVAALAEALLAARIRVDALVQIENEEHDRLGAQVERIASAWTPLMTSSEPSFTPLIDHWITTVRSYGLLDAK